MVLRSLRGAPNQGWAPQFSSAQTQLCCTPVGAVLCSSSSPCPPAPAIPAGSGSSPALPSVSQQDVGDVGAHFWLMGCPEAQRGFGNYLRPKDGELESSGILLSPCHSQKCCHTHCEQLGKRWGEQEGKASRVPLSPEPCDVPAAPGSSALVQVL